GDVVGRQRQQPAARAVQSPVGGFGGGAQRGRGQQHALGLAGRAGGRDHQGGRVVRAVLVGSEGVRRVEGVGDPAGSCGVLRRHREQRGTGSVEGVAQRRNDLQG